LHRLLLRFSAVVLAILAFLAAWPLAATSTAVAAGLGVTGSIVDVTMTPPSTHVHTMTVSNGFTYALDMQVEARGLGQELDGSYTPLTAGEDQSPLSALTYITQIDKTAFHLEPGAEEVVKATIDCPSDAASGTRYACIYIHSAPSGGGPVGVAAALIVPVVVTVPGSTRVQIGDITGLTVSELKSREPIEISTTFKNMSTYHYKAMNQVTIKNGAGDVFSDEATALTSASIIPPFSRLFAASCVPSDPDKGLPPGEYLVVSKVMLEDGTVLDVETTGLTVPEWYKPPTPEKERRIVDWVLVVIGILAGLVVLIIIMYLIIRRVRRVGRPFDSG
jgi:hypothetical protein